MISTFNDIKSRLLVQRIGIPIFQKCSLVPLCRRCNLAWNFINFSSNHVERRDLLAAMMIYGIVIIVRFVRTFGLFKYTFPWINVFIVLL